MLSPSKSSVAASSDGDCCQFQLVIGLMARFQRFGFAPSLAANPSRRLRRLRRTTSRLSAMTRASASWWSCRARVV